VSLEVLVAYITERQTRVNDQRRPRRCHVWIYERAGADLRTQTIAPSDGLLL